MGKQVKYGADARAALQAGVDRLANAVKTTLGPRGRNVILGRKGGNQVVTNDGVTIARDLSSDDLFENIGTQLVKEVASKTGDTAGDGTTTATLLTQTIFNEGVKNVTAGANPMPLKRGINMAVQAVVEELKKVSTPIKSNTEVRQIATISANEDAEIGGLIADAMEKIGKDGIITIEESKSSETAMEVVDGMQFQNGYISPWFITNMEKMSTELVDPIILLYDGKITAMEQTVSVLQAAAQTGKPLLVLAESVEGEAITTMIVNKTRGTYLNVAVKSPGFGDFRKEMLKDIAALTGGTVIGAELGMKLESLKESHFGKAGRVIITHDTTTIVDGAGKKDEIESRISQIKLRIAETQSDYDKEKFMERVARLSSGVAVIRVGASTETEMKEKKMRIDDALHATTAAVEEGIVPGGGVALLRAAKVLDQLKGKSAEEDIGIDIVRRSLRAPIRQIIANAGDSPDVIIDVILKSDNFNYGYDANEMETKDLAAAGIIDPTKVVRSALQNAASIAALLLTTETVVADSPETVKSQNAHAPQDGMYGV